MWPENFRSVEIFIAVSTQWRVVMGGTTGLDYTALQATMQLMAVPSSEWPSVFEDIRIMESEALTVINKKD